MDKWDCSCGKKRVTNSAFRLSSAFRRLNASHEYNLICRACGKEVHQDGSDIE